MNKTRVLEYLGLCMRAKKLVSGESIVLDYIKSRKAKMVFLANDAMKNTTKRITDKTTFYNIPLIVDFDTEELNNAIGTNNRKAVAVTDKNFANMIFSQLNEERGG